MAGFASAAFAGRAGCGGARSGFITQGYGKDLLHYVGNDAPLISIPNAQHHIMADEPLALIASLRTLLASWPGAR